MTRKEKEYLLMWIHNTHNRAEIEFDEKLYFFSKHHLNNLDNPLLELEKAYFKRNAYFSVCCQLSQLLKDCFFDDTVQYSNHSAKLLNDISLTQREDDLIYSFVLGIIHNNRFSNFDSYLENENTEKE